MAASSLPVALLVAAARVAVAEFVLLEPEDFKPLFHDVKLGATSPTDQGPLNEPAFVRLTSTFSLATQSLIKSEKSLCGAGVGEGKRPLLRVQRQGHRGCIRLPLACILHAHHPHQRHDQPVGHLGMLQPYHPRALQLGGADWHD